MSKTYKTIQGDMWDSIAFKLMLNEASMNELLELNQEYADTVVFSAGVILQVPERTEEANTSKNLPPWKR